jgi:hypothetical protein
MIMDLTNTTVKSMRKDRCTGSVDYAELLVRFMRAIFMKEISISLGERLTITQITKESGTWARN